MKLLIQSDMKLDSWQIGISRDIDFDVAILAGNISCDRVLHLVVIADGLSRFTSPPQPVLFVPGNREFWAACMEDELVRSRDLIATAMGPARSIVHLLDKNEVAIGGVRFLGCTLWTDEALAVQVEKTNGEASYDFGMAIRLRRRRWLEHADAVRLHYQQRTWLLDKLREPFAGKTVVITHYAPPTGSALQVEFFEVPVLWIHGHTLESLDYRLGNCRVVCNARGNPEAWPFELRNPQFDPALVIDLDQLESNA